MEALYWESRAAQGWLEDDGVSGASLGDMYGACLDLVAAAGGVE